jgi:septal ring factor EnvC (AmiA/AmiB activator)
MTNIPLSEQNARQLILYTVLPQLEELRTGMTDANASLDRLFQDITTEIQQIRDQLASTINSLTTENADLKSQLQSQVDKLDAVVARVDDKSTELEANDPAPTDNPPSTREIK